MQELAKQFHIACAQGDIGRYCILPGDPGRVPAIAALFDDAKQIAYNREFNVWTGTLRGKCACPPASAIPPLPSLWRSSTNAVPTRSSAPAPAAVSI
ncbi:MAG: hypothetical protein ACLTYN_06985 [Dysosmobacter welbionis]